MAAGHHNGFNPFRDAHGRWATPISHASEIHGPPLTMNDAIRSAAGRPGGGNGFDSLVTASLLKGVDNIPMRGDFYAGRGGPGPLQQYLGGEVPKGKNIQWVLGELANTAAADTGQAPAIHALMSSMINGNGYKFPRTITKHDLLDMMVKVEAAPSEKALANRQMYGAGLALSVGEGKLAQTFLAGRGSAGWKTAQLALEQAAGPFPQGVNYTRRAAGDGVDLAVPQSPRDAQAAKYQATKQNEISGPYAGKTMAEIYAIDKAYLQNIAYDGTGFGLHVGHYLRATGDI
jgi:hypothetical protein